MLFKKIKFTVFFLVLSAMFFSGAVLCRADSVCIKDDLGEYDGVFVAGNPELYPIEHFLKSISGEESASVAVAYAMAYGRVPKPQLLFIALEVLILAGLIAFGLLMTKKHKKLREIAHHHEIYDAKTGVYHKSAFWRVADKSVKAEAEETYYLAKIAPDYGRLKQYYNASQIEKLEKYIAETLKEFCEKNEYAARLDDELAFVCLFRSAKFEIAEARIDELTQRLNRENGVIGEDYKVAVRAGVAHYTRPAETSLRIYEIAEEAHRYADLEMKYYVFATAAMICEADRKLLLQRETAQAVKNGEFLYYLQYIVELRTKEVCGAEALSRWQHPREGLLMPGEYIPLMQQSETIGLLDYYIFEKTCKQLEEWRGTEKENFFISCNFDRLTISEEHFFDKLIEISSKYQIDRKKLYIEITEDTLKYNKELAYRNAVRCKEAGFGLALDDFGSGCAAFNTLLEFPVNVLKLDRSFVRSIEQEKFFTLVSGIVEIARSVGYEVICEGVETEEQCALVEKAGVEYVQGYFYSRVVPCNEAARTLAHLNMRLKKIEKEFSDPEVEAIFDGNIKVFNRVGYSESFSVKLEKASPFVKDAYNTVREALMGFAGAHSKLTMVCDAICVGENPIAKIMLTSKAVLVCLALNPEDYPDSEYIYKDVSYSKKYKNVPMCVKVTDEASLNALVALLSAWQSNPHS